MVEILRKLVFKLQGEKGNYIEAPLKDGLLL